MPTAWDSSLPAFERGRDGGFAWVLPDPAVRQTMADGTVKAARITSAAPSNFTLPYRMSAAQFATFRGWLAGVLAGDQQYTKTVLGTAYTLIITGPVQAGETDGGLHFDVVIPVQQVL
jgi:hypothetical protein